MTAVFTQLHGYRQGHELLSGSRGLAKADQSLIDRLSDLAGPLRPNERFDPYITGYPLPSGKFYVLARTWQDLTVARAGCVRTLSIVIPSEEWRTSSVSKYLNPLLEMEMPTEAGSPTEGIPGDNFPPVVEFSGEELLEALFLEDAKPVAVFDANAPEIITARLLAALWPSLRQRFSVSTFALSPRKIDNRFFDLVFAPADVRSRFTNWPGRRLDAKSGKSARHRWTSSIVEKVFLDARPRLLRDSDLRSLSEDDKRTPSALRVALLWNELIAKLETSPSAALGLLDVANTKFNHGGTTQVAEVEPLIARAAAKAAADMPPSEGWAFITAMLRKVQGGPFVDVVPKIAEASQELARRSPVGAVRLLEQPDPAGVYQVLLPGIARGLNEGFSVGGDLALAEALPETIAEVLTSNRELAQSALSSKPLIRRIGEILPALSHEAFVNLRRQLVPMLAGVDHGPLISNFFGSMEIEELLHQVDRLAERRKTSLATFVPVIVRRARELGQTISLRDRALVVPPGAFADRLMFDSLSPTLQDVKWILDRAPSDRKAIWLAALVRDADASQLAEMLHDYQVAREALRLLGDTEVALLRRIAADVWLPIELYVSVIARIIHISPENPETLARQALQRCLREHFPGDEVATLIDFLEVGGDGVDVGWVIHNALAGAINSSIVSRNLVVLGAVDGRIQKSISGEIESISNILSGRWWIDLDHRAADALAALLIANGHLDAMLRASGTLLPALMRSGQHPVSSLVAVAFPLVYSELAQEDEIDDFLRFIPFVDWDRCKSARHELVNVYLGSDVWDPIDFALTAWRSHDTERFMRRLAKFSGAHRILDKIVAEKSKLPSACMTEVLTAIAREKR